MADSTSEIVFYDYIRSTAAYRVRLALKLKNVTYRTEIVNLLDGDQGQSDFLSRNPQGLIPMLAMDGHDFTQSLAIIDYLDASFPEPRLLPPDAAQRAVTLGHALVIIADMHPINNLRVWKYLKDPFGHSQDDVVQWMHHWMDAGFRALEHAAPAHGIFGGATPDLVDVCLTSQMYNAQRFGLPMDGFPKLQRIYDDLAGLDAFQAAHPDAME